MPVHLIPIIHRGAQRFMTDTLLESIAKQISAWPEAVAVVLGGSRRRLQHDAHSDVDLYIYTERGIPVERRFELIDSRSDDGEIDNRFWETGDEWTDRERWYSH